MWQMFLVVLCWVPQVSIVCERLSLACGLCMYLCLHPCLIRHLYPYLYPCRYLCCISVSILISIPICTSLSIPVFIPISIPVCTSVSVSVSLYSYLFCPTVLHMRWCSRKSLITAQTLNFRLSILSDCKKGHWNVEGSEQGHGVSTDVYMDTRTFYRIVYWLSMTCLRER